MLAYFLKVHFDPELALACLIIRLLALSLLQIDWSQQLVVTILFKHKRLLLNMVDTFFAYQLIYRIIFHYSSPCAKNY